MDIEIKPASDEDFPVVENLARFYVYDMSELMGWPCPENGLFGGCDEFFDDWQDGKNAPFVVRIQGELAGFAGVKRTGGGKQDEHCVQEFFVLRKFRRQGVGRTVAATLFDKYPGAWTVQQLARNTPAAEFWPAVVRDYTGGNCSERSERHPQWGEMNTISFYSARSVT